MKSFLNAMIHKKYVYILYNDYMGGPHNMPIISQSWVMDDKGIVRLQGNHFGM